MIEVHPSDASVLFTMSTAGASYQVKADRHGVLLHLYYGRRLEGDLSYLLSFRDRGFSGNPWEAGKDRTYSLDSLPLELPARGEGDFRSPALEVEQADGTHALSLRYKGFRARKGKYSLPGLPCVHASEAETLEIDMEDRATGLSITLFYGVLEDKDVITRSLRITNTTDKKVYLRKVQPAALDFLYGDYELLHFHGRHSMERMPERVAVGHTNQVISTTRVASSHQENPLMLLLEENTDEDKGSCYALSFVYSGNFKGEAMKDQYNHTRVQLGLNDELFRYPLSPGESFYSPEVILSYSSEGLGKLSQNLHRCIQENVIRDNGLERPVLLNSWEAAYFNFTEKDLLELAKAAKKAGIGLLVLDDGWYGNRDSDDKALGDWYVNEQKLPHFPRLAREINKLGLDLGLWIEPEMVSEDSGLYRAHPDWALQAPGREPVRSRGQLVLDFSRQDVRDFILNAIAKVIDQGNIKYLKWDMNRSLSDLYSHSSQDQGRVSHDYVLGVYAFLEKLRERYPGILIESCAGGGGRFDAGMLYYTPQIWCSDNTDALDRVKIQYGTSFGYPASSIGAHVSAVPNHQTGRRTPLKTRSVTAMAGTFGYELDLRKLPEEILGTIKEQVEQYQRLRPIMHDGLYYRLSDPFKEEVAAWEFVCEGKCLVFAVIQEIHGNQTDHYIRLKGLKEKASYKCQGEQYTGSALMRAGFLLPSEQKPYPGYCFLFEEC